MIKKCSFSLIAALFLSCAQAEPIDISIQKAFQQGMVLVKGGCFEMGDIFEEGEDDESPVHTVCVDDFEIGEHEVTQREWQMVMGNNPAEHKECGLDCPVEHTSWHDANEFIKKLNGFTGGKYRLPTEAEWDYAARDRGKKMRFAGTNDEDKLSEYAWINEGDHGNTHPVKMKKPNELGLYDMTGNVIEWISDRWGKRYFKVSPKDNPKGPEEGKDRDAKGGSWWSLVRMGRISNRYADNENLRQKNHGFRLVQEVAK